MAQQNNSVNLLIHDSSGQQQIIKVMQSSSGKPLTTAGVKAIVKEVTGQDATRVLGQKMSGQSQGIHAVSGQGHSTKNQSMPGNHQNKTIRLTPSQSALKTVHGHPAAQRIIEVSTAPIMPSSSANKKLPTTSSGSSSVQTSRRRKTDKVGRGLRHFSMKVCEKVKEKGITTYNEVADELVAEEIEGQPIDPMNYDQKNIRRRVYDALNVLMAMNIISKEKKEIRWIGLPTNSIQQCTTLEHENQIRKERIDAKHQQLRELLLQQVSFKTLITRNKEAEERGLIPTPSSAIQLPFIIVNTHKKTHINCSISNDKSEYFFKFDDKFEIHDDVEVLKRMGLLLGLDKGECAFDDIERAKTMVPKAFEKYIEMYGRGQDESLSDDWDMSYNETIMENEVILPKTEYCDDDEDDEEIVASEISDVD